MGTKYDNAHEVERDPQADGPYLDEIREAERNARREARMAAAEKYEELAKDRLDDSTEKGEVTPTADGISLGTEKDVLESDSAEETQKNIDNYPEERKLGDSDDKPNNSVSL